MEIRAKRALNSLQVYGGKLGTCFLTLGNIAHFASTALNATVKSSVTPSCAIACLISASSSSNSLHLTNSSSHQKSKPMSLRCRCTERMASWLAKCLVIIVVSRAPVTGSITPFLLRAARTFTEFVLDSGGEMGLVWVWWRVQELLRLDLGRRVEAHRRRRP